MGTMLWTGTKTPLKPGASGIRWHECEPEHITDVSLGGPPGEAQIARCKQCARPLYKHRGEEWQPLTHLEGRLAEALIVAHIVIEELKHK